MMVERITADSNGAPGLAFTAHLRDAEKLLLVSFASARHGGPVTRVDEDLTVTTVPFPERFGRLSPRWIRNYFESETLA